MSDSVEQTVLLEPEGTIVERFDRHAGTFLKTQTIRLHILRIMYADCPYAVLLFFDAGSGVPPWYDKHFGQIKGVFKGWKIDLESPYKRTGNGRARRAGRLQRRRGAVVLRRRLPRHRSH